VRHCGAVLPQKGSRQSVRPAMAWAFRYYVCLSLTAKVGRGTFLHRGIIGMTKSVSFVVLCGLLLCITLVLVLPQVDLPDTAFHHGTAPIVAKARFSRAPAILKVAISMYSAIARQSSECGRQRSVLHAVPLAKYLPTIVCCLRC
jgi:hypothetical protein